MSDLNTLLVTNGFHLLCPLGHYSALGPSSLLHYLMAVPCLKWQLLFCKNMVKLLFRGSYEGELHKLVFFM